MLVWAGGVISSAGSNVTRPRHFRKLYKSEQRTRLRASRMRPQMVSRRLGDRMRDFARMYLSQQAVAGSGL
jgi:hypothetical protein